MKKMFPRALEIAIEAHKNQFRRVKDRPIHREALPYISHPIAVADKFESDYEKTLAVLHDVIEDHPEFAQTIIKEFPEEIFNDLTLLSRIPKETYFEFIMRMRNSHRIPVIKVKIEDINHNSSDLDEGSLKDKYRFAKYILLKQLLDDDVITYEEFTKF